MSEWNFPNRNYKCSHVHCSLLDSRFSELTKNLMQIFKTFAEKFQNMIVVTERNISWCFEYYWHAQKQFKFCVFQKGTILSKQENSSWKGRSFLFGSNCQNRFVVRTDYVLQIRFCIKIYNKPPVGSLFLIIVLHYFLNYQQISFPTTF